MGDADRLLEDRVRLDCIRIFFAHTRGNMLNAAVGAVIIGAVLLSANVAVEVVAVWSILVAIMAISAGLFGHRTARTGITADNSERLLRVRIVLGAGVGLLYGTSGFLLPDGDAQTQDLFIFIVMSTLVTVAALGYAVMPAYYLTLNAVCMLPISVHYAWGYVQRRQPFDLLLTAAALLWQGMVLLKARRVSRTAIDAIVLNERLQQEIEGHKHTREALRQLALQDPLTGLGNRRHFEDTLTRTLSIAARDGGKFGVMAIDLDQFKPVNDRYGHAVGDLLLRAVTERLRAVTRASDFCARVGGDEFAVIVELPTTDDDVQRVAEKIRRALAEPYVLDRHLVRISASVGCAICPTDGASVEDLLRVADTRMYEMKRAGRRGETAP